MHINLSRDGIARESMLSVLYYDRDPAWRDLVHSQLAEGGEFGVVGVACFGEAMTRFQEERFDAVVADPADNELLAHLSTVKGRLSSVPYILFTEPGREVIVIEAF